MIIESLCNHSNTKVMVDTMILLLNDRERTKSLEILPFTSQCLPYKRNYTVPVAFAIVLDVQCSETATGTV